MGPRPTGCCPDSRGANRNIDVTTEMYPYTASATRIESALYDGWKEYTDSMFRDLLWPAKASG